MKTILACSILVTLAACSPAPTQEPTAPNRPLFAHTPNPGVPDIIVDQADRKSVV